MFVPKSDSHSSYTTYGDPQPVRETDVTGQVSVQQNMVQELFEYTKKLEAALLSVLRDAGPAEAINPTPQPPLVPLAAKIQDNNERISAALATVNGILQRLEL